jgi:hypothetical protein
MKDNRPTTVTRDDLKLIAYILLAILAAASIDPLTDAFADFMTR